MSGYIATTRYPDRDEMIFEHPVVLEDGRWADCVTDKTGDNAWPERCTCGAFEL